MKRAMQDFESSELPEAKRQHPASSNAALLAAALRLIKDIDINALTNADLMTVFPLTSRINECYSFLCHSVARLMPPEIWTLVLTHANKSEEEEKKPQRMLQYGLVCSEWTKISNKLFLERFEEEKIHSDNILCRFVETTRLDLSYSSSITAESLTQLKALTSLTLQNNTVIPLECLQQLPCLQILDISSSRFPHIAVLPYLPTVTRLGASNTKGVTDLTFSVPNLKSLTLNRNRFVTSIRALTQLTSLELLDNSHIHNEELVPLTNLINLMLECNDAITELPLLPKLKEINLQSTTIPMTCLQRLPSLEYLDVMSKDDVDTNMLLAYTHITGLAVGYNEESLSIGELTHLNKLFILESEIGDSQISRLLQLTYLKTDEVPNISNRSISLLTNLLYLSFSSEQITEESIQHLKKLTYLCPTDTITGATISQLTSLRSLFVYEPVLNNHLLALPNLTKLRLEGNHIQLETIEALTNLTKIDLRNCDNINPEDVPKRIKVSGR